MAEKEQEYFAFGTFKLPKGFKKVTEYIITRDMTAKEKANELMQKFENLEPLADTELDKRFQKAAALIVVDEIVELIMERKWPDRDTSFWDEVEQEIKAI